LKTKTIALLVSIMPLLAACAASAGLPGAAQSPTETSRPTPEGKQVALNVFAAASLTESFTEIGNGFESAYPDVEVAFNFAGSQQLAQQITQGAPADVFASANLKQMQVVMEDGRIDPGSQPAFVSNRLVVIYPSDNPAGLAGLKDLAKSGLHLVLAAGEVPVGQYSLDFLDKSTQDPAYGQAYKAAVLANVVSYEDNVKAVLNKVVLGEADAGIVYSSDISGDSRSKVGQIEIPDELNVIAEYPIAPVKDSPNPDAAKAFIDYVLSPQGQSILAKYGFIPVDSEQ
jgi:molybdate transport system substrate-binding protein